VQLQHQEPVPPRQLNANVPLDLDTIVLKCLEKLPQRRYGSAAELADELRRFLEGLPITARPPSAKYRLGKLVRRNKGTFAAGALVAATLIAAIVVLAISNASIRKEQVRTRAEQTRAAAAQRLAEQRAEEMRRGVEDLQAANRLLERGRFFVDQQRWDDAEAAFTRAIELRPEYATLWSDRGELYRRLGLFELAVRDLDRAFRLQAPERSWVWRFHALLLWNAQDQEGYRDVARRMRVAFQGTPSATMAMETIVVSALDQEHVAAAGHDIELAGEVVAADPQNAWFHYGLGVVLYRAGQFESAAQELRNSLEVPGDWPARGIAYPVLAMAYHRLGSTEQARDALQAAGRALQGWTRQRYEAPQGNWGVHFGAVGEWPILWWDWLECQLYYQEASLLIDGTPPPDDPYLRILRARALAGLRRTAGAMAEYEAAVALRPDDPTIRSEAHRARGFYFGYRDWPLAADEFGQSRALTPADYKLWNLEAISHLAAGDGDEYRQTCSQMLREFGTTQDPWTANEVVFACVLQPAAVPDPAQLVPLARVAGRLHPGNDRVLGAVCYRAGDYDQAVHCLENSARFFRPRAWEWCFRAMAHHRRGDVAEARRCLEEARKWIDEANRQDTVDLTQRKPLWDGFTERFEFPLLYQEAQTLIEGGEVAAQAGTQ
jgi:tetratricopeptide (TPR) repeat protein